MLKLSGGSTKPLKYEDIVVSAFEMFPDEFALRGYPQYPDSSDLHKPLYGPLKREGLIRAANKTFALTARGVEKAQQLIGAAGDKLTKARDGNRMTRDVQVEVERMLASAAFKLYVNGQRERVLDTDFYAFLGCTVRTPRNDFLGRLTATADAVSAAKKLKQPEPEAAALLAEAWAFLEKKFKPLVNRRKGSN
ncbi:hypothetical protein [Stigmatella erecta]|nr:hypothetical protein [Stigmatella erecta]